MRFPFSHHHLLCFTSSTFPRRARKKISRSSTYAQTTPRCFRKTNAKEEEDKEAFYVCRFFFFFFSLALVFFCLKFFSRSLSSFADHHRLKIFPRKRYKTYTHNAYINTRRTNATRNRNRDEEAFRAFTRRSAKGKKKQREREREREHAPRAIQPDSFFKGATVRIRIF